MHSRSSPHDDAQRTTTNPEEFDDSNRVNVTPLNTIPYVHGGFAGAAPLLMMDKKWMMILKHLMPDAHLVLSNYAEQVDDNTDPLKVMKWAENNPVVAAYGMLHSKKTTPLEEQIESPSPPSKTGKDFMLDLANTKRAALAQVVMNQKRNKRIRKRSAGGAQPVLEWDVFLDPTIVRHVDAAIHKMDDLMNTTGREVYEEEVMVANIEVDRQVSRLMNRMMLAHGSTAQLLVEAVGVGARYNFSRVVKSGNVLKKQIEEGKQATSMFGCNSGRYRDTTLDDNMEYSSSTSIPSAKKRMKAADKAMDVRQSAIFVDRWLYLFSSALRLGKQSAESILFLMEKGKIKKDHLLKKSRSFQHRTSRFLRGTSKSFDNESVTEYTAQEDDFDNPSICGLFLCLGMNDPESVNADHGNSKMAESAAVIRKLLGENLRLVLDMKSRHVPARVWGRLIDNLRSRGLDVEGIGSFDIYELRQIETRTSTPVTTIFFFHSAGDLQRACHANEVSLFIFSKNAMFGTVPSLI